VPPAIVQPGPLPADASFRALSEFDAERSELFLARAALLVEGQTEKLVFPFIFQALGHDADREAISIVECGGKPNMPLFARIHKPEHAWRSVAGIGRVAVPPPLADAVERVLALARD
jgi:hypothetical protein